MVSKETTEYLAFGPSVNLRKLFGFDPSPEKQKQVRIRYRMDRIFGTLILDVTTTSRIPRPITLRRSWGGQRLLKIRRGYYGHPRGMTPNGRMCYEVVRSSDPIKCYLSRAVIYCHTLPNPMLTSIPMCAPHEML